MNFSDRGFYIDSFNLLKRVIKTIEKFKPKWWLEAGTCLGAIRHNNFVPHDTDMDLGIITDDSTFGRILFSLRQEGLNVHICKLTKEQYEVSITISGCKVDIFRFYEDKDILWHKAGDIENQRYEFSKYLFDDLKEINFLGIKCFVPNPPEQYLKERYGDWKKINKNWRWEIDPLCLRKI